MRFHCPGCEVTFTVPDEKIPEGKGVRILCPKCRMPVEMKDRIRTDAGPGKIEMPATLPDMESDDLQDEMTLLDMVEEGVKTALLCVSNDSRARQIQDILVQMGFYIVSASKASLALRKLHNNRYDLVVMDEAFDAESPSENLVLHHIQLLPMHVRRQFFLCLLSESKPTLDQLVAFRAGVDMILNMQDFEKIKIILVRAMKEHRALYKLYADELVRKGQT